MLVINGVMFVLLAAVAVAIWLMMSRISDDADSVRTVNVPQLQRISEMELNVTRVSLQLRHAILARNAQDWKPRWPILQTSAKPLLEPWKVWARGCSMTKVARRSCPCKAW